MTKKMSFVSEEWGRFSADLLVGIREYAPYFSLSADKQDNEIGVVLELNRELSKQRNEPFRCVESRGLDRDPPDCEAEGKNGERVGIEVTELVDESSIRAARMGALFEPSACASSDVVEKISTIIRRKDQARIKGGSYDVYVLIIYCDDPYFLTYENIEAIRRAQFARTNQIDRAYFLESYLPLEGRCPYIELCLR